MGGTQNRLARVRTAFVLSCLSISYSLSISAQTVSIDFDQEPQIFNLIAGLKEVSGLAAGPDNTVFAHNDEYGIVYQISLNDGQVVKAFALGNPTIKRDFEGIEVWNGRIYLLSHDGKIYEAPIGENKSRVKYNAYDTGVGDFCETEGLTLGPIEAGHPTFLIVCKKSKLESDHDRVMIYKWSLLERRSLDMAWRDWERKTLTSGPPQKFNPSALVWSDDHAQVFIMSAKGSRFVSLTEDGDVVQMRKLSSEAHPQAEGLLLMPSGDLVVADEGKGGLPPRLSLYRASSNSP